MFLDNFNEFSYHATLHLILNNEHRFPLSLSFCFGSFQDYAETARTAAINQEIKRILTEVLLKVTAA